MRGQVSKASKNDTLVKTGLQKRKEKLVYLFFSTQEAPNEKLSTCFSLKWNQKKCHLPPVLTLINTGFLLIKSDQKKGWVQGGVK